MREEDIPKFIQYLIKLEDEEEITSELRDHTWEVTREVFRAGQRGVPDVMRYLNIPIPKGKTKAKDLIPAMADCLSDGKFCKRNSRPAVSATLTFVLHLPYSWTTSMCDATIR